MLPLISPTRPKSRIVRAWQDCLDPVFSLVLFHLFARLTYESLTALEIPNDMLQIIQDLILDLRIHCIMVTLQHTAEGILGKITFPRQSYLSWLPSNFQSLETKRELMLEELISIYSFLAVE